MHITYGYVRVSSKDQNEDRQLIAMREYGLPDRSVYVEKCSGKDFNRPVYRRLIKRMGKGDTLVIKSIDRLGRNYEEIKDQWRMITREKGITIVVLDMPLLSQSAVKDLTGTLIADIVLELLSYVAETERDFIRARQAEGIAAAKARGVRFGAPPKPRPPAYEECARRWREGSLSARAASKLLGVHHNTFLQWIKADGSDNKPPDCGAGQC